MHEIRIAVTRAVVGAGIALAGTGLAGAAEGASPAALFSDCHGLGDNTARLQCYDRKSGFPPETEPVAVVADPDGSQWQLETETSALDGRTDVWLKVASTNLQPNQIGRQARAYFYVRCMQKRTNSFISFESYTSRDQQVRYKIDTAPVKSVWMETMDGGRGIGLWSGNRAIPFVRGLFGGSELVVAYASFSDNNLEFTFDISGLRQRIDPLAESCGWKP